MITSDEVFNTRFQATKLREGYDQDEVDTLVERVMATVAAPVEPQQPGLATALGYQDSRGTATPPGTVDVRRGRVLGLFRRR